MERAPISPKCKPKGSLAAVAVSAGSSGCESRDQTGRAASWAAGQAKKPEPGVPGGAGDEGQVGPRAGDRAIPEAECTVPGASDGGVQALVRGGAHRRAAPGSPGRGPGRSRGSGPARRPMAGLGEGHSGEQAAGQQAADQEAKVNSRLRRQVKGSVARSPDAPECSPG